MLAESTRHEREPDGIRFTHGPPCRPSPIYGARCSHAQERSRRARAARAHANHHDAGTSTAAEAATNQPAQPPGTLPPLRQAAAAPPKTTPSHLFGCPHGGTCRARERPAGKAGTRHGWRVRQPSRGHRPHHLLTSSRTDRPGVGGGNHANQPDPESNASEPPGLAAIGLTKHGAHKVRAREEATGKSGRTRPGNGGRSRS